MDKYDYVIAKPEMEEVLYHAGFHKYIDKYLGKNGKWIYKYAGQAKNAVSGVVNKAKTMLPGLQKQATGAVSTARKQASSMMSTGRKTASTAKKQAQKRINAMLPILSKKFNSAKKKARSQAAGVKLVARDKTKKLKKQADGTMKSVSSAAKKVKNKNLYQRAKYKVGTKVGKYGKNPSYGVGTRDTWGNITDPRYKLRYSKSGNIKDRGYNRSDSLDLLGMSTYNSKTKRGEIGRQNDATAKNLRNKSAAKKAKKNRKAK